MVWAVVRVSALDCRDGGSQLVVVPWKVGQLSPYAGSSAEVGIRSPALVLNDGIS